MSVYTSLCITDGATWGTVFGESSGTTCTDFVGGVNATYSGSPTLGVSGPIAGTTSATFASASSQYASAADNAVFDLGTGNYSIELVFKVAASDAGIEYLMGHNGDGGAGDWAIRMQSLLITARHEGTSYQDSTTNVGTGVWDHWVWTATRAGNGIWYRNGASSSTRDISGTSATSLTNTGTFYLARRATTGYWDGTFAAAIIYKGVVLNSTQVAAHYAAMDDVLSAKTNRRGLLGLF